MASRTDVRATPNSWHSTRFGRQRLARRELPVLDRIGDALADLRTETVCRLTTGWQAGGAVTTPALLRREPLAVALDVERLDDRLVLSRAPVLGRHEPHDLELQPVGILRVEALVVAVVAGAVHGAPAAASRSRISARSASVGTCQAMWYIPTGAPAGLGRRGLLTDGEERDVVVVDRAPGARMKTYAPAGCSITGGEAEYVLVEALRALCVSTYKTAWFMPEIGKMEPLILD